MPVEFSQLQAESERAKQNAIRVRALAKKVLRKVSLDAEREIKKGAPVDTGRFRASWGNWTGGVTLGRRKLKNGQAPSNAKANAAGASAGDGIWEVSADGLSITQGSNLAYAARLADGWSKQAAAGWIDVIEARAQATLANALEEVAKAL